MADTVIHCPHCAHGIDAHGSDPGGPCGVGDFDNVPCTCMMSPNDIALFLIRHVAEAVNDALS